MGPLVEGDHAARTGRRGQGLVGGDGREQRAPQVGMRLHGRVDEHDLRAVLGLGRADLRALRGRAHQQPQVSFVPVGRRALSAGVEEAAGRVQRVALVVARRGVGGARQDVGTAEALEPGQQLLGLGVRVDAHLQLEAFEGLAAGPVGCDVRLLEAIAPGAGPLGHLLALALDGAVVLDDVGVRPQRGVRHQDVLALLQAVERAEPRVQAPSQVDGRAAAPVDLELLLVDRADVLAGRHRLRLRLHEPGAREHLQDLRHVRGQVASLEADHHLGAGRDQRRGGGRQGLREHMSRQRQDRGETQDLRLPLVCDGMADPFRASCRARGGRSCRGP